MKTARNNKSFYNSIYIITIIFLLFLVGYLAYLLKTLSSYQSTDYSLQNREFLTENPPASTLSKNEEGDSFTFTHLRLPYSVSFPSDWTPKLFTSPVGYSQQPYRDLILYGPSYEQKSSADTPLELQKSALILIRGEETSHTDIESKFKENLAVQKIARNIKRTTVNGIPAIQYDYSFRNENASIVSMIRDGFWYYIKFQYDNEEIKTKYQDIFQSVLNSFAIKDQQ